MEHFLISEGAWDLRQPGRHDQQRHTEKINEAIKKNLPGLISSEQIILADRLKTMRIPIRTLTEYKLRYSDAGVQKIGRGNGKSKINDTVAVAPGNKAGTEKQAGTRAGDRPGIDYFEADVPIMAIEKQLFNELALPELKKKPAAELIRNRSDFCTIRRSGLTSNIDKKRTLLSALKRHARMGKPQIYPLRMEDLRFRAWTPRPQPENRAVVLALMDTSGSMGEWEKYIARSFFFWTVRFLRSKYKHVSIRFIAHHTEAALVSKEDFFTKGESGGTICSSAYAKALDLIRASYPPEAYSIYPFHFSDGDNLAADNPKCLRLVRELMNLTGFFGYGEINPYHRSGTLMGVYRQVNHRAFHACVLRQKSDVYNALRYFFRKTPENEPV